MEKVDQKKILVLGGTKHMINVVETAKRMGMLTIVVDNIIGSPAKIHADKAFNTSTADVNELVKIVRNENVDGIFTAFEDISTWNALALCKKTNLPFYATGEQVGTNSNNEKFKEICRRFEVPVIEERDLYTESEKTIVATWEFPIIIKSADQSGTEAFESDVPVTSGNLPILLRSGIVGNIYGLDKVRSMPQIVSCDIDVGVGDEVMVIDSYTQIFGSFNIVADSFKELYETIEKVYSTLRITDQSGEDMLLTKFVPEPLPAGQK